MPQRRGGGGEARDLTRPFSPRGLSAVSLNELIGTRTVPVVYTVNGHFHTRIRTSRPMIQLPNLNSTGTID